jgi:hypothetical protein
MPQSIGTGSLRLDPACRASRRAAPARVGHAGRTEPCVPGWRVPEGTGYRPPTPGVVDDAQFARSGSGGLSCGRQFWMEAVVSIALQVQRATRSPEDNCRPPDEAATKHGPLAPRVVGPSRDRSHGDLHRVSAARSRFGRGLSRAGRPGGSLRRIRVAQRRRTWTDAGGRSSRACESRTRLRLAVRVRPRLILRDAPGEVPHRDDPDE